MKKPSNGFFTHLFFASEIIIIFGGLLLHIPLRILKVKLNCIRVPTTDFARKKLESGKIIQIKANTVGRQEISLPNATSKIDLLIFAQFQKMG